MKLRFKAKGRIFGSIPFSWTITVRDIDNEAELAGAVAIAAKVTDMPFKSGPIKGTLNAVIEEDED